MDIKILDNKKFVELDKVIDLVQKEKEDMKGYNRKKVGLNYIIKKLQDVKGPAEVKPPVVPVQAVVQPPVQAQASTTLTV